MRDQDLKENTMGGVEGEDEDASLGEEDDGVHLEKVEYEPRTTPPHPNASVIGMCEECVRCGSNVDAEPRREHILRRFDGYRDRARHSGAEPRPLQREPPPSPLSAVFLGVWMNATISACKSPTMGTTATGTTWPSTHSRILQLGFRPFVENDRYVQRRRYQPLP
jgi:hypothetical protein